MVVDYMEGENVGLHRDMSIKKILLYYVYILWDPITGKPMYVGKGKDNRKNYHVRMVKNNKIPNNNRDLRDWIRGLLNIGLEPIAEIFFPNIENEKEAYALETALINAIGIENLLNRHANNWVYNSALGPNEVEVPIEQQTFAIVYNSKKFGNGISHAEESFQAGVLGIKGNSTTLLAYRNNLLKVKKGDIIFLYETVPESGIQAVCQALDQFSFDVSNQIWTNTTDKETFSCQVPVKFLNFRPTRPFSLKNRTKDWAPRSAIINITPKKDFINEVFRYFEISPETLEPDNYYQKVKQWIARKEIEFITYTRKQYSTYNKG